MDGAEPIWIAGIELPPDQRTPLVESLLRVIAQQQAEIDRLRAEIARLKGLPPRPTIRPSTLNAPPPDPAHKKRRRGKRPGSAKRHKTPELIIHETVPLPVEGLPEGTQQNGYEDFVVQDLRLEAHNICYRRLRYRLPDGSYVTAALPADVQGHFGPTLQSYVLYQHYQNHVTQPLLHEELLELGIHGEEPRRIVTEAALFGTLMRHELYLGQPLVSDDAGQFKILGLLHALCWLHAERSLKRLLAMNPREQAALDRVRHEVWKYYQRLRAYRESPTPQRKQGLQRDFRRLFRQRTGFADLNQALRRIYEKRDELLLVLDHPEIPLHNNLSEQDIREWAKKRKISAGTRSELGRRCRDTFLSLKKTCRKLGVSFWRYLQDRIRGLHSILPLPDLIRQAAQET